MSEQPPGFDAEEYLTLDYELQGAYDGAVTAHGNRRNFFDTCFSCWYLRQGTVGLEWSGGGCTGHAGDWVLGTPLLRRSQQFSADAVILSVRFHIRWRSEELFHLEGLPARVDAATVPELLPAAAAVVACTAGRGPQGVLDWRQRRVGPAEHARRLAALHGFLACWHRALPLAGVAVRGWPVRDPRLRAALALLREHEGLGPVPYQELARRTGLGRAQLDRLCVAGTGLTPRRWLERRCLGRAEELLRDGGHSIKEIAARLRFADSSHFAKWFRRQTRQAPLAFRRRSAGV